jgi:protein TonB
MTSLCLSALASLDDSLALLHKRLGQLEAAKPVDLPEVIEQLKMAAESARIARQLIWSELPQASWQNRTQLDAHIARIQDIQAARALEQLRSRLLALATELERGSIVHRRALRVNELNRLREQAINELRSQAALDGAPQTLPGPQAGQWIEWACGLQEPQDAESLQNIRDGFAHLDDFVANLEPNMWVAAEPSLEGPQQPQEAAPWVPDPAAEIGFDVKDDERVLGLMPAANPPFSQPKNGSASSGTPAVHSAPTGLAQPLASLDRLVALLYESLETLNAAQPVDGAEVIRHLKSADECARIVRELVSSELPEASWQNRKELGAVAEKIQEIQAARTLQQMRSRLLALAAELERGSIVHRRALRVSELNQLREQAINELRSQAGPEGVPNALPGPDASRWMDWACGLQDPQDAVSLQALQKGFAHLDDFVANLEPNMWVAAGQPTSELPAEARKFSEETPPEPPRLDEDRIGASIVSSAPTRIELEASKPLGKRDPPRFSELLDEPPRHAIESNTLTPNDVTAPPTREGLQRIQAQERALFAGMMGLVSDPVGHFGRPAESPFTPEALREHTAAAASPAREPIGHFNPRTECSPTVEVLLETSAAPAVLTSERVGHVDSPVERAFSTEIFRETRAKSASPVNEPMPHINPPVDRSLAEEDETRAVPASTLPATTGAEEHWPGKWRTLLATPAVIVVAALLFFAALGALLWNSYRNRASNSPVIASERTVPDQAPRSPGNPQDKGPGQTGTFTNAAVPASNPKAQAEKPSKPQDQSAASKPSSKVLPAKQASEPESEALRSPEAAPGNLAMVRKEEGPPGATAEMPIAVPGGVPSGASNNLANVVGDIPVAVPNIAGQKVRVSSGVAQGLLVRQVTPKYPAMAQQARIQGTVVLQAVIGKDGTVQNLHVISGPPMLIQAAMDAVRQWRYKPYHVNGEPVEADTQINVNFKLPGG